MSLKRVSTFKLTGFLIGAVLAALAGLTCVWFSLGAGLTEFSYDLPYFWRTTVRPPEVVLVYLDRESRDRLGQGSGPWDRRLHTRLLQRLAEEKAAMVFYDIFFTQPGDPEIDRQLGQAIRGHGRVILGAHYVETPHQSSENVALSRKEFRRPLPLFEEAANGVGLMMLKEGVIQRRLYTGTSEMESAPWVAARLAGAALSASARRAEYWLNFYGPPWHFPSVGLSEALAPDGVPPNFFRGKMVFVGGHPALYSGEQFATPYTRFATTNDTQFAQKFSSGVEIHATAFLNLVRGDWLKRIGTGWQMSFVLGAGVLLGGFVLVRPWQAAGGALLFSLLVAGASLYLQFHQHRWWSWLVPVAVQAPLALVWSIGFNYLIEGRKRRQLHRAFRAYLPPHLVDRIAERDFDLTPGGKEVEATILFTDLEGFTALSEKLPPGEVSQILTAYFDQVTRQILDQEGTVIKYIGDAVMAVWGAPLPDPDQAERAVLAACAIIETGQQEFLGRRLRTRIGLNTGRALAGNLGSFLRFDYTVIGATTNLASRLEKLNQMLGTDILITGATRQRVSERVRVRALGRFLVKGISEAFPLYEVVGTAARFPHAPQWIGSFEEGLARMEARDWEGAKALFQQTITQRGGPDGPAQFFLNRIAQLRSDSSSSKGWDGVTPVVDMS